MQLVHNFEDIISVENLLLAWREFLPGKKTKPDVQLFSRNLMDNIVQLHEDLANQIYRHGGYHAFHIHDPKPRHIHKASVRDRVLHHAVYRILYPFFDRTFIADSYSCRVGRGTHKAGERFRYFARQVSKNNTQTCWVLKCDIKKFFASIDHEILLQILKEYIPDKNILWLLDRIIGSFEVKPSIGLPLGNLTSQLFVNVYMNEFDQFSKHRLQAEQYIRYADDFVVFSKNHEQLLQDIVSIRNFLWHSLHLQLHPQKLFIKTLALGVDFLGWIYFPYHKILRTATKHRMFRHLKENSSVEAQQSYLGLLKHGKTYNTKQALINNAWLWRDEA